MGMQVTGLMNPTGFPSATNMTRVSLQAVTWRSLPVSSLQIPMQTFD